MKRGPRLKEPIFEMSEALVKEEMIGLSEGRFRPGDGVEKTSESDEIYKADEIVYIFHSPLNNFYKIGTTTRSIKSRLNGISTASPAPVHFFGAFIFINATKRTTYKFLKPYYTFEKFFHAYLDDHREHGEWFHGNSKLDNLINLLRKKVRDSSSGYIDSTEFLKELNETQERKRA